ncbi:MULTISPECIES: Hsp33 family molecular chaperone [unclassified Bartonella]|uniref:Hsp33 family molecular chaperone n=1 Tax=unclassified Bartonella TaxID=2645622 RepID=UPI0015F971E6|nr:MULTISPECIES: Hsp33 family molecular chaperone [unclassified Bartonella]UXN02822.1 Hsp33 family molecular chaperone [Bartonella sp. HY406]UXN05786.1 Hsp33 family molecular chaperone [Bartonella sp. HY761]
MTQKSEFRDEEVRIGDYVFAGDDAVVPFEVERLDARGRAVQLGASLNSILDRHNYPSVVSKLLAEVMVLTILLGSSLKFQGKLIVQTSSNGPVNLLVCDYTTPANLRAYARFDEDALNDAIAANKTSPEELLGQGTMALTVDQGANMQLYQGIVALDGSNLQEIAVNYFRQSEQIPTQVRLAVAELHDRDSNGKARVSLRAGGLLVQFLPQSTLQMGEDAGEQKKHQEAHWEEVEALVNTVESDELTDPDVPSERLLYRLFHEQGVRVFEATTIIDDCSCSREKIYDVLSTLSAEEIADSTEDGKISVTCEFCSTHYDFDPADFLKS